ncbi:TauD/TfdA family dioxygenase [Streptomyces sp. NPDC050523]|uniref:TauD/TfdA family dioxygenase n=1 Tax=Streptomyces sp. NPDC050523 TaxID=3365622 RepID=UPI0037B4DB0B
MAETPHAPTVPAEPFTGPALWYGPDLAGRDDWILQLSAENRDELRAAAHTARTRAAPLLRMTIADFPLTMLATELERAAKTLSEGRGFLLIKGVPEDLLAQAEAATVLRGIGQYLGSPVPQTAGGHTLCHIRDVGPPHREDPAPPACLTRAVVPLHTSESDLLGLLCLRPARSGGRTLLASAAAVHNAVLGTRPHLAARLYGTHPFDRRQEQAPGDGSSLASPLVTRHGDRPSMRYDRARLDVGARAAWDGTLAADTELYDVIDTTAASPAVRLELDLEPGDLLLLDNHVVLHGRSAYEDFDAAEQKRHLLRLWLARPGETGLAAQAAGAHVLPTTRTGVTPRDVVRPRSLRTSGPGCLSLRAQRDESRTPRS